MSARQDMNDVPAQATRADICRGLREHYERVSMAQCDWASGIGHAIAAYEREPDLQARLARVEELVREVFKDEIEKADDGEGQPIYVHRQDCGGFCDYACHGQLGHKLAQALAEPEVGE